ncbi:MAG: hypothetical protein ACRD5H_16760, partial [Nitrososphaerales archaeon]
MTRSRLTYVILLVLLVYPALTLIDAYGHGTGPSLIGRPVSVQDEQFSDNTVTTDQVITISGKVESRLDRVIKLSPYIYVTPAVVIEQPEGSRVIERQGHQYPLSIIYPPYRDHSTWYFRVEHDLPNPLILGPGESIDYEIKVYPRKAGTYHVHSYFVADNAYLSRGETVEVTGEALPTFEEVTQLYLPLAAGAVAVTALTLYAIRRVGAEAGREKALRICFAIKCSYETAWASGVSFWLVASFAYLYPLERTYVTSLAVTATLAAITFGGYVTAVSKRRTRQRLFGIGTSAATVIFYLALGYMR